MSIQIAACFKKEILAFFRTGKVIIIAAVLLGLSAFSPLMITGLGNLMDAMSDIYDEMGIDIGNMTGIISSESALGVTTTISDLTTTGLIVYLLLINRAAGGEQKHRNVIIPNASGLRSDGYLIPKYIIYPPVAFVLAIFGLYISWAVSSAAFETNTVTGQQVLLAGVLTGVSMMFYICCHITLGTATGRAGVSAAVCIGASFILPNLFVIVGTDYLYNPFAINVMASSVITAAPADGTFGGNTAQEIITTVVFALGLMVLLYFIALFAQNAKRIDNSGNDMEL